MNGQLNRLTLSCSISSISANSAPPSFAALKVAAACRLRRINGLFVAMEKVSIPKSNSWYRDWHQATCDISNLTLMDGGSAVSLAINNTGFTNTSLTLAFWDSTIAVWATVNQVLMKQIQMIPPVTFSTERLRFWLFMLTVWQINNGFPLRDHQIEIRTRLTSGGDIKAVAGEVCADRISGSIRT